MKCPICGKTLKLVYKIELENDIEYIGDCENCLSYWRWTEKNKLLCRFFCG